MVKVLRVLRFLFCLSLLVPVVALFPISQASEISQEQRPIPSHPAFGFEDVIVAIDWCPSEANLCRLHREWTAAEIKLKLGDQNWRVWQQGDQLTFVYRGSAGEILLGGGILTHLTPIPDSEFWAASVRVNQLDHAIVRHWLYTVTDNKWIHFPETLGVWRGKHAPPPPPTTEDLRGVIEETELYSEALNEHRRITYYLPSEYSESQTYPVVYMTDGDQLVEFGFPNVVEPLIESGLIPPTILVAVHAAPFELTHDRRAEEYVPGINDAVYSAHEQFFTETVRAWAEEELNASRDPSQRAVMGYSRGAVFAGNTGIRKPDTYGHVMMFSPAEAPQIDEKSEIQARYYLLAGTLEEYFYKATESSFVRLHRARVEVVFNRRIAGHASTMWVEEFPRALKWMYDVD